MKKFTKGFTLIELLIVIALLGALAVALLAALDPLEQIKKGTDTGVRNTVAEIASAFTRYASVKSGTLPYSGTVAWGSVGTDTTGSWYQAVNAVIKTGELKTDFFSLAQGQLNRIYIIGDLSRYYVCFAPEAKSFKSDNNTKFVTVAAATAATMIEMPTGGCDENGTVASAGTTGATAGATCFWCVR